MMHQHPPRGPHERKPNHLLLLLFLVILLWLCGVWRGWGTVAHALLLLGLLLVVARVWQGRTRP